MTNKDKVRNVLEAGKKITIWQAQKNLIMNGGTFTKIISDLRKEGLEIDTETRTRKNRNGVIKRYKVYWLRGAGQ